jgi:hypothetical protein
MTESIQQTGKFWKLLRFLSKLAGIVGVASMFLAIIIPPLVLVAGVLCAFSIVGGISARIGIWWFHE